MRKDKIILERKPDDLFILAENLKFGYFVVEKNYDSQLDAISYHLRITPLYWLFSRFIKN